MGTYWLSRRCHLTSVRSDTNAVETHADTLARLGIELRAGGPNSVALHAFPSLLERIDPAVFVRDLLDLLSEQGSRPSTDTLIHALMDMMACKPSRPATP